MEVGPKPRGSACPQGLVGRQRRGEAASRGVVDDGETVRLCPTGGGAAWDRACDAGGCEDCGDCGSLRSFLGSEPIEPTCTSRTLLRPINFMILESRSSLLSAPCDSSRPSLPTRRGEGAKVTEPPPAVASMIENSPSAGVVVPVPVGLDPARGEPWPCTSALLPAELYAAMAEA